MKKLVVLMILISGQFGWTQPISRSFIECRSKTTAEGFTATLVYAGPDKTDAYFEVEHPQIQENFSAANLVCSSIANIKNLDCVGFWNQSQTQIPLLKLSLNSKNQLVANYKPLVGNIKMRETDWPCTITEE